MAPGTWHLAPGTWHLAPGTWHLAPGTWHLDAEKRWSFSALSRYEIHSEKDEIGITPGDSLVVEWRLGLVASPEAPGRDDWSVLPTPSLQLDIQGYRLQTRGPGLAADLVPSNRLSLGLVVQYNSGRSEDDLGEIGQGLPIVPVSVETGPADHPLAAHRREQHCSFTACEGK